MSAGGRRHGDATLPVRAARRPGLLPAGKALMGGRKVALLDRFCASLFVFVVERFHATFSSPSRAEAAALESVSGEEHVILHFDLCSVTPPDEML